MPPSAPREAEGLLLVSFLEEPVAMERSVEAVTRRLPGIRWYSNSSVNCRRTAMISR